MICQYCGVEAPTKYVDFHQNIGVLFIRFGKSIDGQLCKTCIHHHFWSMTTTTILLGWWGLISFFLTPIFLVNNVVRYLFSLGMEPVAPGSKPPELNQTVFERMQPYSSDLFSRLGEGEELTKIAPVIAERAGITPGQVVLFAHAVAQAHAEQETMAQS